MRQETILSLVQRYGTVRIEMLAERFGVTTQTIRRDVRGLCDRGLLRRYHGSVGLMQFGGNLDFERRRVLHLPEKRRIARAVAERIPDGASLFLGIGTTPVQVAQALLDHTDLLVVTNNLGVVDVFAESSDCSVRLAGGKVRNHQRDLIDPAAADVYSDYLLDFAIFGVGGVDPDGALLDFDRDEVRAREAMARNARSSVLVLDHSKIGRAAPARGGHIRDVELVVTDHPLPSTLMTALQESGVELDIAAAVLLADERIEEAGKSG